MLGRGAPPNGLFGWLFGLAGFGAAPNGEAPAIPGTGAAPKSELCIPPIGCKLPDVFCFIPRLGIGAFDVPIDSDLLCPG